MSFDVETDPGLVVRSRTEGDATFEGAFVVRSGRYLFPQHGWRDDVPARLAELALALAAIESGSECERVTFGDRHYTVEFHGAAVAPLPASRAVRITYHDAYQGGLVYQEHIEVADVRRTVALRIQQMLNVCVKRRWLAPVATLSAALEGLTRAARAK